MPLFDWVCNECDKQEESFEDLRCRPCLFDYNCCGTMQKLLSAPLAFNFKGTGTYDKGWVGKK